MKAVIFDLDGTLMDRDKSLRQFLDDQYERYHEYFSNVQRQDYIEYFIEYDRHGYVPKEKVYPKLFDTFDIHYLKPIDLEKDYQLMYPRFVYSYDDTVETLQRLSNRGYKLGVITNGTSEHQRYIIDVLGIENLLTHIIVSEEVGYKKPDKEIFLKMANDLSEEPKDCMYVGDHPINDVLASYNAGMISVFKDDGYFKEPEEEITYYKIKSISELLNILDEE